MIHTFILFHFTYWANFGVKTQAKLYVHRRDSLGAEALLAAGLGVGQEDGPERPQEHGQRPDDQSGQKLQKVKLQLWFEAANSLQTMVNLSLVAHQKQ